MDSGQDAFNHELMIATSTELKVLYFPVPVLNYLPVLLCIAINMLSHLTEELHGRETIFKWGKSESE